MNNRFSREHILKTIKLYKYDPIKHFITHDIIGYIMEIGFFVLLFYWTALYLYLKFDFNLFLFIEILLIFICIYFYYLIAIKYYKFKTSTFQIKLKNIKNPTRIVFVSDIHAGTYRLGSNNKRLQSLVKHINNLNIDLVIFGGDYVVSEFEMDILNELKKVNGKYKIGVYGNHDSLYLKKQQQDRVASEGVEKIKSLGIEILVDEGKRILYEGNNLFFGGISDLYSIHFDINKAFEGSNSNDTKILLSHNPDIIDFVEETDEIDLILSGHTHAGMIHLPIIGALLPMPSKYRWLTKGIFQINKRTKLLLSQGSGYSGTKIRIGTYNEVCVVELLPEA